MSWLVLSYLLSVGTLNQNMVTEIGNAQAPPMSYQTEIGLKLTAWNLLYARADITTDEFYGAGLSFRPFLSTYTVGAGVHYGVLTVGVVHWCTHPVVWAMDKPLSFAYAATSTSVFLKVSGKLPL